MKKNTIILLIFFLAIFKVGHLFYKWIKDEPKPIFEKEIEIESKSMLLYSKFNLLDGNWVHEEDSLSTIEIKYKKWTFLYNNKFDEDDIYRYQITDTLLEYANTEINKGKFLILTTEIDTLKYELLTYNDSIMSLIYLPRGNIHVYLKKE